MQKTAYEMRISDWSSDVCSSDLPEGRGARIARDRNAGGARRPNLAQLFGDRDGRGASAQRRTFAHTVGRPRPAEPWPYPLRQLPALRLSGGEREHRPYCRLFAPASAERPARRSEEHTSELQSLMRFSYAVLCLKKKINSIQLYS